jgi:hypothetical protein
MAGQTLSKLREQINAVERSGGAAFGAAWAILMCLGVIALLVMYG